MTNRKKALTSSSTGEKLSGDKYRTTNLREKSNAKKRKNSEEFEQLEISPQPEFEKTIVFQENSKKTLI